MDATLIVNTNGTREIQYGKQSLELQSYEAQRVHIILSEMEVIRIREAATEDVQRILSELY